MIAFNSALIGLFFYHMTTHVWEWGAGDTCLLITNYNNSCSKVEFEWKLSCLTFKKVNYWNFLYAANLTNI